jgi:UDP-glucose 4-epimerase
LTTGKTKSKILCIGGNGFMGGHVVDLLLREGHTVSVLDPYPEKFRRPNPQIRYFACDLSDTGRLDEALEDVDTVIHLFSSVVPATAEGKMTFDLQSNLLPTLHLLDRMLAKGIHNIVFFSSGGAVYGNPDTIPTPEHQTPSPISVYGQGKWIIENYLRFYAQSGLQPLIIRPSNVYGIRQGNSGVLGLINTLLDAALNGVQVSIYGKGETIRDYLHVSDLTTFLDMALRKSANGVYNVGSGLGHSVSEVMNLVEQITGRELKKEFFPSRPFDVDRIVLDNTKAHRDLGWTPVVSLEQGIREVWDFKCQKG